MLSILKIHRIIRIFVVGRLFILGKRMTLRMACPERTNIACKKRPSFFATFTTFPLALVCTIFTTLSPKKKRKKKRNKREKISIGTRYQSFYTEFLLDVTFSGKENTLRNVIKGTIIFIILSIEMRVKRINAFIVLISHC